MPTQNIDTHNIDTTPSTTEVTLLENHRLVAEWIDATNSLDEENYLTHFTDDAELDDPSVGSVFVGKAEIGQYFSSYFIGYKTGTELLSVVRTESGVHVEVRFTGDFPGGVTGGIFDLVFEGDLIKHVRADLTE